MKEDIIYYLQTVMFPGTPCIFGNILWSNTGCYKPTRAYTRGAKGAVPPTRPVGLGAFTLFKSYIQE